MGEPNLTLTSTDPSTFKTDLNLPEYLLKEGERWRKNGKTVWAIDCLSGESQEYGTFEKQTRSVASFLTKRGVKFGETLIYMSRELISLHILYTGVWRANGIARAHYPDDTIETIFEIVLESDAKWIVCDDQDVLKCQEVRKLLEEQDKSLEIIVVGAKAIGKAAIIPFQDLFSDSGDDCPELMTKPGDIALVLPTSGTTGKRSKGVALSHSAVISNIQMYNSEIPWTDTLNFMMVKSMHISGSTYPFSIFCAGKSCLVIPQITIENILAAIEKYKPGCLFGFINFITAVANKSDTIDTTSVETIVSGGVAVGPAIPDTLKQFKNFKTILILYGLTEANVLAFHPVKLEQLPPNNSKPLSVGKVGPYTSVQIRDIETGKMLGANELGEIHAKTSNMFTEYVAAPQETEETFVDGWLRTGDIGYYDEEGFIYVDGRIKEMFKSNAFHIIPSELDEVISRHPAVATACTIGIPDPEGGEKMPRAYVTLKEGYSTCAEEILQFAHGILASYKKIRGGIFIVSDLPRGSSGKITRALVQKKFLG